MAERLDKSEPNSALPAAAGGGNGAGGGDGGRYRIIGDLGTGATANVVRAHDRTLGIDVALKRLRQVGPEALLRLKREFRTARDLAHPNLVRLYDLVADGADIFFTMELVLGTTISECAASWLGPTQPHAAPGIAQVCRALFELALGVKALHAAKIIHRDIKPANVLVDGTGRVVLLDFGFASPAMNRVGESEEESVIGTLQYMAPERLWGGPPTPTSDWYSLGVLAADLFLQRSLFEGTLQDLIRQKDRPPATLRPSAPWLPPELDDLMCRLLHRETQQRPTEEEILSTLQLLSRAPAQAGGRRAAVPFVGRQNERDQLRSVFDAQGGAVVRVLGPSGIGKTALVQEVCEGLPKTTLVFRGRCHPREQVPFAALDEVMDNLSHQLHRLPARERAQIIPNHFDALMTLFPVLGRAVADASSQKTGGVEAADTKVAADPSERRAQAALALRELWSAVAARRAVVIWIDDLQWSDRDGLQLLRGILSGPRAPAIHWVFCERTTSAPVQEDGDPLATWGITSLARLDLTLTPLSNTEAETLARVHGLSQGAVTKVVAEAGGFPFFVAELAHFLRTEGAESEQPSVSAVVDARVSRLPAPGRRILEYLSLSTEPLVGLDIQNLFKDDSAAHALPLLENAGLIRVAQGQEAGHAFEPAHDRIREAVTSATDPAGSRQIHLDLADLLTRRARPSSARLAFHYRAGGDQQRALEHTLRAAREAMRSLAFGDASDLLRGAVELHPRPVPATLYAESADALIAAGRCGRAAENLLMAADAALQEGERGPVVRRLRRQAGEQFLYAGHIAQGRRVLTAALLDYGIRLPRFPLMTAIWRRGRFLLSGRQRSRTVAEESKASDDVAVERIDALCNIAKGTIMVEHVLGDSLVLGALHEALKLGDDRRLSWPLALEAAAEANIGGPLRGRSRRLLERASRMAGPDPGPSEEGWLRLCRGTSAYFEARWREGAEDLAAASQIFRTRCVGATYEYATTNVFLLASLAQLGRYREMSALLPTLTRWARERGNFYADAMFSSGSSVYSYLAADQPARAIEEANRGLAAWHAPGFTSQHFQHFITTLSAHLYKGNPWAAWERVVSVWPDLRRSRFLDLEYIGVQLRDLRARAALAAASAPAPPPPELAEWSAQRLARVAAADGRRIGRSPLPHAAATAAVLRACLAALHEDQAQVLGCLTEALAGFDAAAMPHLRECARLAIAERAAGSEDDRRRQREQAIEGLSQLGVTDPGRFQAMLIPLKRSPR